MPRSRGRGRRRQGARRFEQKPAARPIERPTIQKTMGPTTTTQTTRAQRPTQDPLTSISHVKSDIIEHVEDIHLMLEHMIVKTIKDQALPAANISTAINQLPANVFSD